MFRLTTPRRGVAVALVSAALLGACAQQDATSPMRTLSGRGSSHDETTPPVAGMVTLAKFSVVPGEYSFHIDVSGGGDYYMSSADRTLVLTELSMLQGAATYAYAPQNAASWTGKTAKITITETAIPAGLRVDSIQIWYNDVQQQTLVGPSSASVTTGFSDNWWMVFYNGAIPQQPPVFDVGYSACPVGFWKKPKNSDKWAGSGLTTTQSVGSLFAAASQYSVKGKPLSQLTLLDGLKAKGDGALAGAAEKLIRTGIAAELNARRAGWNYPMTAAAIADAVNNTLATRDKKKMRQMASTFRQMNKSNKGNVDPDDDDDDDDPAVSCPLR